MRSFHVPRPMQQSLWLLVAFLVLLTLRPADVFAQATNAGTVSQVSGTVQLQRGAATIPVTLGMPVEVGDRIIIGDDRATSWSCSPTRARWSWATPAI